MRRDARRQCLTGDNRKPVTDAYGRDKFLSYFPKSDGRCRDGVSLWLVRIPAPGLSGDIIIHSSI